MYTQFFGLSEKPFSITPDPHFLFLSERHAEALAHLVYGVTESGGFIQLTGEVGTGKTTLTRSLLERLPDTVDLAAILNPRLTVAEFLEAIFNELGHPAPASRSTRDLVDALNRHLLAAHERGRKTVLLVDEAQNLDADVLEQLRLLTNLETSKQKLLQIILVGQPELRTLLARNDLRQLAQRITGRYHLEALNAKETVAYVRHRMAVAGAQSDVFTSGALWEIHRASRGIPRVINVLCDRALLGAYSAESHEISRRIVRRAADEVRGTVAPSTAGGKARRWLLPAAAVALLGAGLIATVSLLDDPASGTATAAEAPGQPERASTAMLNGGAVNDAADSTQTGSGTATQTVALALPPVRQTLRVSQRLDSLDTARSATRTAPNTLTETLTDVLARGSVDSGTDTAFAELFTLWGEALTRGGAPCVKAQRSGLRCAYQVGSLRLLRTLNRPAILSLVDDDGRAHNAVVTSISDSNMTLRFGSDEYQFSIDEVARLWLGEFLVLWRPMHGEQELLLPGRRDPGVVWLRRALGDIQSTALTSDDPTYFDRDLQSQVQQFQRRRRLEADGKAGVQTLIAINSAQRLPGTPYLEVL